MRRCRAVAGACLLATVVTLDVPVARADIDAAGGWLVATKFTGVPDSLVTYFVQHWVATSSIVST